MDNQHKKIAGYRDLTESEIEHMNMIKAHGKGLGELIDRVKEVPGVDQRWVAIAKTDLQKGIMALVRSVARPEGF